MATAELEHSEPAWRDPWRNGGVVALARSPRLLAILVRGELRDRYQGTWLGGLWDYVRPITRFIVYFAVIGVVLGLQKSVENFGLYIFSGLVVVQSFNAALTGGTRSLQKQHRLLRRVNIPAAGIPIAAVLAAFVRQRASIIVLLVVTVLLGWRPEHLARLPYAVGGIAMLTVFVAGLSMITSVMAMHVKDTQYAVETLTMLVRWASPVLYPVSLVSDRLGETWTTVYLANPVTIALEWLRVAVWAPTVDATTASAVPDIPAASVTVALVLTFGTFAIGAFVVRRTEHQIVSRVAWTS